MSKRLALAAAAVFLSAGLHAADDMQENVGVGLGTTLFKGHDGLMSQVFAATTNGSSGNQTFAVTSGTSGAKKPSSFVENRQIREFVADNMDTLAREMATGSGETLAALAELMNVSAEQLGQTSQANFEQIYSSDAVTSDEVVAHLDALLTQV